MYMRNLLVVVFIASCFFASAQTEYDSLKTRAQLSIDVPDGYEELEIDFLHKIPHNFVIGKADSSCQVRYWIRPLDTWVADFNKKTKKEQKNSMKPNALCKSMMMLAVLDASNNKSSGFQEGQIPELTKEAFNADWEAAALIETGWPQVGFKYCYIWCLHKDDVGDVYIYVLADKQGDFMKILGEIAPMVKFNEE